MILSVDPGVSTGVALLMDDGSIDTTFVASSVEQLRGFIDGTFEKSPAEDLFVVVEEGPKLSGNYRSHIQEIEEVIKIYFPLITWVPPSQWKNHPGSFSEGLKGLTQHEKDAVGLGRWFRKTHMNERSNTT